MNSSLVMFSRMVWKEYRSLRMLWVGCGLGTLALFVVILGLEQHAQQRAETIAVLWSLGLWVPAIYLLGCAVASFAGEREGRTADWLIGLAAPQRSTIMAKFLWPIVSALTLQLALFGVVLAIQSMQQGGLTKEGYSNADLLNDLPIVASWTLVEALAWGMFWSLQSSRPMNAVAGAALSIVCVNILAGWVGGVTPWGSTIQSLGGWWELAFTSWGWLRAPLTLSLLVWDVVLARQWLAGRPWDWAATIDSLLGRWQRRAVTGRLEPSLPWRRAWQRLFWLEAQSIRYFLAATIGVSLLGLIPIVFWSNNGGLVLPTLVAVFLPMFAGLVAWSGEQTRQQFRFLTHQGLTPTAVWLNKATAWLIALCVAVAILAGVSLLAWMIGTQFDPNPYKPLFPLQRHFPQPGFGPPQFFGTCLWYGTLTFAGALAVGVHFRRAIIAFGIGLLLTIALWFWIIASDAMQLPHWLFLGPLVVWLLWCSLRQTSRWMIERTGWRTCGIIAAEWLIVPAVVVCSGVAYWVYSVPSPDVAALRANIVSQQFNNPNAKAEWHAVTFAARSLEDRILEKLPAEPHQPPGDQMAVMPLAQAHANTNWQSLTDASWEAVAPDIRQFRDLLLKPISLPLEPHVARIGVARSRIIANQSRLSAMTSSPYQNQMIVELLIGLATRALQAGQVDDAVLSVRAAVRYVGVLWCDMPLPMLNSASDTHAALHQELIRWAQHPAQTQESLSRTLKELERQELRWWLTDAHAIFSTYDWNLDWMDERREHYFSWWSTPPWWYAREKRLLACELSNRMEALRRLPRCSRSSVIGEEFSGDHFDAAWDYRGVGRQRWPLTQGPLGLEPMTLASMWDRETRIRCTFAAMAIAGHHRLHGQLPKSLHDVIPELASDSLLQDPWSYGLLQFEPSGLPDGLRGGGSGSLGYRIPIPGGTPFVWSIGPEKAQILHQGASGGPRIMASFVDYYGRLQATAANELRFAFPVLPPAAPNRADGAPVSATNGT